MARQFLNLCLSVLKFRTVAIKRMFNIVQIDPGLMFIIFQWNSGFESFRIIVLGKMYSVGFGSKLVSRQ